MLLFTLVLLFYSNLMITCQTKQEEINIAALVPYHTIDNGCTKTAIQFAIDDINKENFIIKTDKFGNITSSYQIRPRFAEVDNEDATALNALYSIYRNNESKVFVATIGPPYIEQSELCDDFTTEHANNFISYSDVNEPLKLIFGVPTPPSIISSYYAASELLKHFNWSRIAIIYDNSNKRYVGSSEQFRQIMRETKIQNKSMEILADQGIWSEPASYHVTQEFDVIQNIGARINFALVSISGARKIFCQAYHREMYSPSVVWILFEILPLDWASNKYNSLWNSQKQRIEREINCSEDELLQASRGYIAVTKQGLRKDNIKTRSGMTSADFRARLFNQLGVKCHENVAYAYDAVWTIAFGHQAYVKIIPYPYKYPYPAYYWYPMSGLAIGVIRKSKFEGLTGPISFQMQLHNRVHRIGQISIWSNSFKSEPVYIGQHDTKSNNLSFVSHYKRSLFQEGTIPKDIATYINVYQEYAKALVITMWSIAILGMVLSSFCLVIILIYGCDINADFTSPLVYSITVLGSYLCFVSVIIYGIDTRFVKSESVPDICWSFLITLSIGFTLTFGSLFTKAWQMYKEYLTPAEEKLTNGEILKKPKKEWYSFIIIFIFLIIDIIILITWKHFSTFHTEIRNITKIENPLQDIIKIEQISGCSCKYQTEFTIGMYCYKGAILIFGLFIAWQSRNIKGIDNNTTKPIALAIYNVVAVSIIGVICTSVLTNTTRQQALYAIVAVCICVCTITTLLLIFLPKILRVVKSDRFFMSRNSTSDTSSANDEALRDIATSYLRRSTEKHPDMIKPGFSTGSLTTEVSSEQTRDSVLTADSQLDIANQSVISITPSHLVNSVFSTQTYLTNSTSTPSYLSISPTPFSNELEKQVDAKGRLSSGVYVGTITEEKE